MVKRRSSFNRSIKKLGTIDDRLLFFFFSLFPSTLTEISPQSIAAIVPRVIWMSLLSGAETSPRIQDIANDGINVRKQSRALSGKLAMAWGATVALHYTDTLAHPTNHPPTNRYIPYFELTLLTSSRQCTPPIFLTTSGRIKSPV